MATKAPRYGHEQEWSAEWEGGNPYRPRYPSSTTKLIMDYHRAHSNSLRLAHDIGSGSGVFVPTLAGYFQHVHVSDPDPSNVVKARQNLGEWYKSNWWKAKMSFSATAAEEANAAFVQGSVDFCSLMMSAHWTDVEAMVAAVGDSLAPNGTLAILQYNPACAVVENDEVDAAVQELFQAWREEIQESDRLSPKLERGASQRNLGLDYVPLPEGVFIQDVTKRIKINPRGESHRTFAIPSREHLVAPSRVNPLHRKFEFAHPDPEADGWRQEVDAAWFRGLIKNMVRVDRLHHFEMHLRTIETAIQKTSLTGDIVVEWSVVILLATRK